MSTTSDRINQTVNAIGRHWLAFFNTVLAIYVSLPIIAPVLMGYGLERPAGWIYTIYSPTCHQMAFRSFFVGGEQYAYPRTLAGTSLQSFESYATEIDHFSGVSLDGLPGDLIISARTFLGNAEMGYKTAICQRDLGIFGFLLIGGLLYALLRPYYRIKPMPLILFIIIGMGPIGLDGFSQLFGYYRDTIPLLEIFATRESPPFLRTATGAWFGLCVAWLALPYIDQGMKS